MPENGFRTGAKVLKVDSELGLVFGFAIICKQDGEDYYDLQGDHIPEEAMIEAALDFAENSQVAKEMHGDEERGVTPFLFPMTTDVAKAFGLEDISQTGLMIAIKPDDDMLEKFKSGELTGFSIGGRRIQDEEVDQ